MTNRDGMHWVGTWTTTTAPVEGLTLRDQTLRMIARISIGGQRLRVRLSNACGGADLPVSAAHLAVRSEGASILPGSDRVLSFGGNSCTVIPAGAFVISDPVDLDVTR